MISHIPIDHQGVIELRRIATSMEQIEAELFLIRKLMEQKK